MKKVLLLFLFVAAMASVKAQNIQLHYDFGEGRKMLTSTVEMFKPDQYGSTFFFIDMDYGSEASGVDNGVSLAYWEIARAIKWEENQKILPRVEYNGGTMVIGEQWYPIEHCFLAGLEKTWASADFSKIFSLQANYKYIKDKENASFQITGVWAIQMADQKLTFSGFADFWKEEMFWGTDYRFLTEPQLWYNPCKHFSLGGELEISSNFVGAEWAAKPTIAVKYTF